MLLGLLRSLLSQGPHTLHMWSYPNGEEGAITYQADKLSAATNPDVAHSVAISFLLDCYSFPVALPNSLPTSGSCEGPSSALTQSGSPTISSPRSPAVNKPAHVSPGQAAPEPGSRDTNSECFRRLREESVLYHSALPRYFRNVNWMNHKVVQNVHWLVGNCYPEELDLTVALELLSLDFPDMMVRRLAVQRLESLSNEDVLKYLLQLVQVCTLLTNTARMRSGAAMTQEFQRLPQ